MINNYKQLTGRYLKSNMKRTILTVIGIVLSIALISSIGLFFKGIEDAEIQSMKDNYGSHHLMFSKVDEDLISKINSNPKVARSGLLIQGEEIKIDGRTSITQMTASGKALELLPCRISEGKLPENKNEIAIEKWVLGKLNKEAKIGDKIKLNDKEYTLTGILQDGVNRQYDGKGIAVSKDDNIQKEDSFLLVEISQKTNLRSAVDELKKLKDTVSENTYLLSVQGASEDKSAMKGIFATIGIIITIVLIATIAVIYNAFQISVVERIKQFGLLRAVGTTPKQIRSIVLREATILALIGIPIGLLCGIIAIYGISIAFKIIGGDTVFIMKPSVSPKILLISGGVGLVSIYLSAMIPAFFAGRVSPLVAISSRNSISKERIKRRRSFISSKLFGFEGAMASKNIKRNKRRYRVTVFSVVISVVLFITFKSFMDMSMKISNITNESDNIHFSVMLDSRNTSNDSFIDDKAVESVKASKYVKKIYNKYPTYDFNAAMDKSSETKEIQDIGSVYKKVNYNGNEKTLLGGAVTAYDNSSLEASKKYLTAGNIDLEKMNKENGVIIINENRVYNEKTKKSYYGPVANLKVGDEIELQKIVGEDNKEFGKGNVKKVKVLGVVKSEPFNFNGYNEKVKLITTEDVAKRLAGVDVKPQSINIIIDDVKNENAAKAAIEEKIQGNTSLRLINYIESNRMTKSSMLMIQILIYGFVVVVSLIGSVNIINTITTNIIIRRREFAALKSIGLTQRGLKKMIVLEGLLYGISGTVIGSLIGSGLSYSMFKGLNGVREFSWNIPWNAIIIAGAAAMIISYLSVLAPLRRIKKENLIEAVREDF